MCPRSLSCIVPWVTTIHTVPQVTIILYSTCTCMYHRPGHYHNYVLHPMWLLYVCTCITPQVTIILHWSFLGHLRSGYSKLSLYLTSLSLLPMDTLLLLPRQGCTQTSVGGHNYALIHVIVACMWTILLKVCLCMYCTLYSVYYNVL